MNWKRLLRTASVALLIAGVWIASGIDFSWREKTTHADTFAVQNLIFFGTGGGDAVGILTPSANGSVRIYSVAGFCNSTSSADIIIAPSPQGGLNEYWQTAIGDVNTSLVSYYWVTPLQAIAGQKVSVTLHGCASNSNLFVQTSVN